MRSLLRLFMLGCFIGVAALGYEFVRFVAREQGDARPCPACRHEAEPLGFASAAAAFQYERAYAQP